MKKHIMVSDNFSLKHILGLKVHDLRVKKDLSFQDLSESSGLSISYLSEIEKGKKYPKGDKILALAKALDVTYDELVSLKVSKKLTPIINLLQSDFFKEFPLDTFGLEPQKIIELLSNSPEKVHAFINSIINIARNYEMRGEHFHYAALRSYQEMNDNYFSDIETAVKKFIKQHDSLKQLPNTVAVLEDLLKKEFDITIDRTKLSSYPELRDLRSFYQKKEKRLLLHNGLTAAQEAFLIGRELGFHVLGLKERPAETPPYKAYGFEGILNNYKASYFSAALILPEQEVITDINKMALSDTWNESMMIGFIDKYQATPEMIMQRLTNILPKHFGLKNLFFLRFVGTDNFSSYDLTKELHLSRSHNPHTNSLNETYCRRWLSIRLIKQLRSLTKLDKSSSILAGAQISQYYGTEDEYLCLTLAFPNVSNLSESISVTIGFYVDANSKKRIKFISDPAIKSRIVNTTCQRCGWTDCEDRIAPPTVIEKETAQKNVIDALLKLDE
ncbi:XRE family transcriptional regulator [Fulvivirga lutea]|uniref:Helix-turn-helix domain-containing protein n=1 Tax=Fulvivirga lutea TaxID=2810512 RepID=A0A974WN11_9BACT|nr:XRE family transcriptional regulator [Fulvivirga lutea]QSE98463.1 helix-turn-helix domain-containing protein [Fulvivirga lutea]